VTLGYLLWCGLLFLAIALGRRARAGRPAVLVGLGALVPVGTLLLGIWGEGLVDGGPGQAWGALVEALSGVSERPHAVWLALSAPAWFGVVALGAAHVYARPRKPVQQLVIAIAVSVGAWLILEGVAGSPFGLYLLESSAGSLLRQVSKRGAGWLPTFLGCGVAVAVGQVAGARVEARLALRLGWVERPPIRAGGWRPWLALLGALLSLPLLLVGTWEASADLSASRLRQLAEGAQRVEAPPGSVDQGPRLESARLGMARLHWREVEVLYMEFERLTLGAPDVSLYEPESVGLYYTAAHAIVRKAGGHASRVARLAGAGHWVPSNLAKGTRRWVLPDEDALIALSIQALRDLEAGRLKAGWERALASGRLGLDVVPATLVDVQVKTEFALAHANLARHCMSHAPPPPSLRELVRALEGDVAGVTARASGAELLRLARGDGWGQRSRPHPRSAYRLLVPSSAWRANVHRLRLELGRLFAAVPDRVGAEGVRELGAHERRLRREGVPTVPMINHRLERELRALTMLRALGWVLDQGQGSGAPPLPPDPYAPERSLQAQELPGGGWRVWGLGWDGDDDGGEPNGDAVFEVSPAR
jgi:hypothetical protein